MQSRRRRAPTTQLARAGERTRLLIGDAPVKTIRFKATVLGGTPSGRVDVETVDGTFRHDLSDDNRLQVDGLISMSVVPSYDTAITFVPTEQPRFGPAVVLGGLFIVGAVGLTAWDFLGL